MIKNEFKTKTFKTPDGKSITMFDGKLHCWEHAAIQYPPGSKSKDEYYLYGIQYTKDQWNAAKQDTNGEPPHKNPQVTEIK